MGSPKQLLLYRGRPLIRHAAEVALQSTCDPIVVVLGSHADEIRIALAGLPLGIVENASWEQGMGTSIHSGVAAAHGMDGIILALADQPLITPEIYDRLIGEHQSTGLPIIASRYSGTAGVPVFFSRQFFPHLLALPANQGCKGLILGNQEQALLIDCPEAEEDVDTPADYERLRQLR